MNEDDPIDAFEAQLRTLTPRPLSEKTAHAIERHLSGQAKTPRRLIAWWAIAPLAAAACLVLALILIGPDTGKPSDQHADGHDPAPLIALANWRVQPTGDARFTVLSPNHVQLDRGELYFESTDNNSAPADAMALTITTPAGEAVASGTRFYIGSHSGLPTSTTTKGPAMKKLTRILILTGVVTLTNPLGSVTGHAHELLAAEEDKAPTKIIAQVNTGFALDLYTQLDKENKGENLFFSPYSITSALAMAAEGARGQTALEMGQVLNYPEEARRIGDDAQRLPWETAMINSGYKQINERINKQETEETKAKQSEITELRKKLSASNEIVEYYERGKKLNGEKITGDRAWQAMGESQRLADNINKLEREISAYELKVANAIWVEKTYDLRKDYADAIGKYFGTNGIQQVDFRNNFAASAKQINQWVEGKTNNRIKDLIPEEGSPLTRVILTNAIFFKGEWAEPFDAKETEDKPFLLADGKKVKTPIMFNTMEQGKYAAFNADGSLFNTPLEVPVFEDAKQPPRYPGADGFAMAELNYKGDEISMVLIAPNKADGLPALEKQITPQRLDQWMSHLTQRDMEVYLPRFKMQATYKLNETLQAMGMKQAFIPPTSTGGADFSGISASGSPIDQLSISAVLHKTFIEVNEKGTEAAAATAVILAANGIPQTVPFEPEFRADRPFIYLIRDNQTGTILFMGRVVDPSKLQ